MSDIVVEVPNITMEIVVGDKKITLTTEEARSLLSALRHALGETPAREPLPVVINITPIWPVAPFVVNWPPKESGYPTVTRQNTGGLTW